MNNNKITSKVALNYVIEHCELPADVAEKLNAMLATLDRKSAGAKSATPTQKENLMLKDLFYSALTAEPHTVTDIIKTIDFPALIDNKEMTTQRATPILRSLEKEGFAKVSVIKGRNYYSIAVD